MTDSSQAPFQRMYDARAFGERWDNLIRSAVQSSSIGAVARRLKLSEAEIAYIVEDDDGKEEPQKAV